MSKKTEKIISDFERSEENRKMLEEDIIHEIKRNEDATNKMKKALETSRQTQIEQYNNQQAPVKTSSVNNMTEAEAKKMGNVVYNLWKKNNSKESSTSTSTSTSTQSQKSNIPAYIYNANKEGTQNEQSSSQVKNKKNITYTPEGYVKVKTEKNKEQTMFDWAKTIKTPNKQIAGKSYSDELSKIYDVLKQYTIDEILEIKQAVQNITSSDKVGNDIKKSLGMVQEVLDSKFSELPKDIKSTSLTVSKKDIQVTDHLGKREQEWLKAYDKAKTMEEKKAVVANVERMHKEGTVSTQRFQAFKDNIYTRDKYQNAAKFKRPYTDDKDENKYFKLYDEAKTDQEKKSVREQAQLALGKKYIDWEKHAKMQPRKIQTMYEDEKDGILPTISVPTINGRQIYEYGNMWNDYERQKRKVETEEKDEKIKQKKMAELTSKQETIEDFVGQALYSDMFDNHSWGIANKVSQYKYDPEKSKYSDFASASMRKSIELANMHGSDVGKAFEAVVDVRNHDERMQGFKNAGYLSEDEIKGLKLPTSPGAWMQLNKSEDTSGSISATFDLLRQFQKSILESGLNIEKGADGNLTDDSIQRINSMIKTLLDMIRNDGGVKQTLAKSLDGVDFENIRASMDVSRFEEFEHMGDKELPEVIVKNIIDSLLSQLVNSADSDESKDIAVKAKEYAERYIHGVLKNQGLSIQGAKNEVDFSETGNRMAKLFTATSTHNKGISRIMNRTGMTESEAREQYFAHNDLVKRDDEDSRELQNILKSVGFDNNNDDDFDTRVSKLNQAMSLMKGSKSKEIRGTAEEYYSLSDNDKLYAMELFMNQITQGEKSANSFVEAKTNTVSSFSGTMQRDIQSEMFANESEPLSPKERNQQYYNTYPITSLYGDSVIEGSRKIYEDTDRDEKNIRLEAAKKRREQAQTELDTAMKYTDGMSIEDYDRIQDKLDAVPYELMSPEGKSQIDEEIKQSKEAYQSKMIAFIAMMDEDIATLEQDIQAYKEWKANQDKKVDTKSDKKTDKKIKKTTPKKSSKKKKDVEKKTKEKQQEELVAEKHEESEQPIINEDKNEVLSKSEKTQEDSVNKSHKEALQDAVDIEQNKIEKSQELVTQLDLEKKAFQELNEEIQRHSELMGNAIKAEDNKASASKKVIDNSSNVNKTNNVAVPIDPQAILDNSDLDMGIRETYGIDNIMMYGDPRVAYTKSKSQTNPLFGEKTTMMTVVEAELDEESHKYKINGENGENKETVDVNASASQLGSLSRLSKTKTPSEHTQRKEKVVQKLLKDGQVSFKVDGVDTTFDSIKSLETGLNESFSGIQKGQESIIFGNSAHKLMEIVAKGQYSSIDEAMKDDAWIQYLNDDNKDLKKYQRLHGDESEDISRSDFENRSRDLAEYLNTAMGSVLTNINADEIMRKALAEKHLVGTYEDGKNTFTLGGTFDSIFYKTMTDFKTGKIDINKFTIQMNALQDLVQGAIKSNINLGGLSENDAEKMFKQIAWVNGKTGEHGRFEVPRWTKTQRGEILTTAYYNSEYDKEHPNLGVAQDIIVDESMNWKKGASKIKSQVNRELINALNSEINGKNIDEAESILKKQGFSVGNRSEANKKGVYSQEFTRLDESTGQTLTITLDINNANGMVLGDKPIDERNSVEKFDEKDTPEGRYKQLLEEDYKLSLIEKEDRISGDEINSKIIKNKRKKIKQQLNSSEFDDIDKSSIEDEVMTDYQQNTAQTDDKIIKNIQNKMVEYQKILQDINELQNKKDVYGLSESEQYKLDELTDRADKKGKDITKGIKLINDETARENLKKQRQDIKKNVNKEKEINLQESKEEKINNILEEREKIYARLIELQKKGNLSEIETIEYENLEKQLTDNEQLFNNEINKDIFDKERDVLKNNFEENDSIYREQVDRKQVAYKEDIAKNRELENYINLLKQVNKLELERDQLQAKVKEGGSLSVYNQQALNKKEAELKKAQSEFGNYMYDNDDTFVANGKTYTLNEKEKDAFGAKIAKQQIENQRTKNAFIESQQKQGFFAKIGNTMKQEFDHAVNYSLVYQGIAKLRQALTDVIQKTKEFNKTMIDIQIVTGSNASEVSKMIDTYNDYAKELGVTTQQVAESANQFLRMGYNAQETAKLIESSMKLSKLGMIEAGQAAEYLTSAIKGYQLSAQESERVVDMATTLDMSYAIDAGYIFEAMSRTATSAKLAKVEMSELQSMISVVGETTQKDASVVGESMKTAFARYGNVKAGVASKTDVSSLDEQSREELEAVNDIERVLSTYNIDVRESDNKTWRSYSDILKDINEQWAKYSDYEKNAITTALFGTRQRENGLVVLEKYNEVLKANEKAINSEGNANKKYETYLTSVEAAQNRMTASWEDFVKKIQGSGFLKLGYNVLSGFIEALDHVWVILTAIVALNLTSVIKTVGKFSNIFGGGLIRGGNTIKTIGSSFFSKDGLKGIGRGIKDATGQAFKEVDEDAKIRLEISGKLNTTNEILKAILRHLGGEYTDAKNKGINKNPIVTNNNSYNSNSSDKNNVFGWFTNSKIGDKIKNTPLSVRNWLGNTKSEISSTIGLEKGWFSNIGTNLKSKISGIKDNLIMDGAISPSWKRNTTFKSTTDKTNNWIANKNSRIKSTVGNAKGWFNNVRSNFAQNFSESFGKEFFSEKKQDLSNWYKNSRIKSTIGNAKGWFNNIEQVIKDDISYTRLSNKISNKFINSTIGAKLSEPLLFAELQAKNIGKKIKNIPSSLGAKMSGIKDNLIMDGAIPHRWYKNSRLKSTVGNAKGWFSNVGQAIKDDISYIRLSNKISNKFINSTIGAKLSEPLLFAELQAKNIGKKFTNIATSMKGWFSNIGTNLGSKISGIKDNLIMDGIKNPNWFNKIYPMNVRMYESLLYGELKGKNIENKIKNIPSSIKSGISSKTGAIKGWFGNTAIGAKLSGIRDNLIMDGVISPGWFKGSKLNSTADKIEGWSAEEYYHNLKQKELESVFKPKSKIGAKLSNLKNNPAAMNFAATAGSMLGMVGGGLMGSAIGGEYGGGIGTALGIGTMLLSSIDPIGGALVGAVTTGLGTIITLVKKHNEKQIKLAQESYAKSQEKVSTLENSTKDFNRYDLLARGVNEFGNNVSLSDSEYEEFLKLGNNLGESFPKLITRIDETGNSFLGFDGKIGNTVQGLEEFTKQLKKSEAIAGLNKDNLEGEYRSYIDNINEIKENIKNEKTNTDGLYLNKEEKKYLSDNNLIAIGKNDVNEEDIKKVQDELIRLQSDTNTYMSEENSNSSYFRIKLEDLEKSDELNRIYAIASGKQQGKEQIIKQQEAEIKRISGQYTSDILNNLVNSGQINLDDDTKAMVSDLINNVFSDIDEATRWYKDREEEGVNIKDSILDIAKIVETGNSGTYLKQMSSMNTSSNNLRDTNDLFYGTDEGGGYLNNLKDELFKKDSAYVKALETQGYKINYKKETVEKDGKTQTFNDYILGLTPSGKSLHNLNIQLDSKTKDGKNLYNIDGLSRDVLQTAFSQDELREVLSMSELEVQNIIGTSTGDEAIRKLRERAIINTQNSIDDVSGSFVTAFKNLENKEGIKIFDDLTESEIAQYAQDYFDYPEETLKRLNEQGVTLNDSMLGYLERLKEYADQLGMSVDDFVKNAKYVSHLDLNGFSTKKASDIKTEINTLMEVADSIRQGNEITGEQMDALMSSNPEILNEAMKDPNYLNNPTQAYLSAIEKQLSFFEGASHNVSIGGYYAKDSTGFWDTYIDPNNDLSWINSLGGAMNASKYFLGEDFNLNTNYKSENYNKKFTDKSGLQHGIETIKTDQGFTTDVQAYDYLVTTFGTSEQKQEYSKLSGVAKQNKAIEIVDELTTEYYDWLKNITDASPALKKILEKIGASINISNEVENAERDASNYYGLQDLRQKISRQREDYKEQLKDLEIQKRLNELEHYLQKRNLLIDRYNNEIANADWALDIIAPSDYFGKIDITSNKLEATLNKYNELKSKFKELSEMTPQSPEEAQKIADTMKSITDQMPELTKELAKAEESLKNIALDAIGESIDNVTSAFDRQRKVLNNSVEMSMSFTGVSSSLDLLGLDYTPLIENKTEVEKKQDEYETLLSMQEDFQNESLESQNTYLDLLKTDQEEEYFKNKKRLREDDLSSMRSYYNELWAYAKLGKELTESEMNAVVSYFKNVKGIDFLPDFYQNENGMWKYSQSGGDPTNDEDDNTNSPKILTKSYAEKEMKDLIDKYPAYENAFEKQDDGTYTINSSKIDFSKKPKSGSFGDYNVFGNDKKKDEQKQADVTTAVTNTIKTGIDNIDVNSEEIKSSMETKIKDFLVSFKTTWDEYLKNNTDENLVLSFVSLLGYNETEKNSILEQFKTLGEEVAQSYVDGISQSLGKGLDDKNTQKKGKNSFWNFGKDKDKKSNVMTSAFAKMLDAESLASEMQVQLNDALVKLVELWDNEVVTINDKEHKIESPELYKTWFEDNIGDTEFLIGAMYYYVQEALKKTSSHFYNNITKGEEVSDDLKITKPQLKTQGKNGWGENGLVEDMIKQVDNAYKELNKKEYFLNAPTPDQKSWENFGKTIAKYISDGMDEGVQESLDNQAKGSVKPSGREGMSVSSSSSHTIRDGNAGNVSGDDIVNYAKKQIGKPYIFGAGRGKSDAAFDCSGLTQYVLKQQGINIGSTAAEQWNEDKGIKIMDSSQLQAGDLLFYKDTYKKGISHVGIYSGNGKMIDARGTNYGVVERPVDLGSHYVGAKRYHNGLNINTNTAIGRLISEKAKEYNLSNNITSGETNAEKIWNYFISKGMTPEGVAGLMGNLFVESGYEPKNLQGSYEKILGYNDNTYTDAVDSGKYTNFIKDTAGYGLAQWTYWSRKKNLLNFAKSYNGGTSIGDLDMQLAFLLEELKSYSGVYDYLLKASNVEKAMDKVLTDFEGPGIPHRDRRLKAAKDVYSAYSHSLGTSYHKGGKALLGDENLLKGSNKPSPEALIYPNGKVEIVGEDGPVIKDIPVGTQVLTTSQTKSLFNNIPSYAEGSYSGGAYFTKDNIDNITEDAKKMLEEILTPFEKSAKNILISYQNKSFYKRSTLENFNQIDEDTVDYIDRERNQSISSAYMKENQLQTLHMEGRLYNDQIDVLVKKYKELQESGADEATLNTVFEQIDKLQDAVKNVNNQLSEWLNSMISYAVAVKEAFSAQIEHENTMLDLTHSLGGFGEKTDANYYSQKRERSITLENEIVAAMEEVKQRIISEALESGDSYEQALEKVYANEDYRRLEQERLQEKQKRKELLQEELDNNKQLIDYKQTILDLERSERWTSVQSINDYYAQTDNYLEQRIKFLKEALTWENLSHEEYIEYSKELAQAEKDRANNIKEQLEALQDFYNRQYDSMNYMVQEYITALNDEKETISKTYDEEIRKLQTVNDQKERGIKLTELQTALDNAKKEKKRVYRAGVGFVYEENREEINKAEKELEDFYSQDRIDSMNEAKELELKALDERIEGWNKYLEAIEKVYKTAERHDHMRNLEKLYGVEGWNGIWDVLDSDLNTFLTNKESGQDIYYGENTGLLHNYIETSDEIYKKMDEIVDVLKDISGFVQSDISYSTIKWTDLMYDVDDFDAASSDQTMIDMLNKKHPDLNIDSKLLSRLSIEKSNDLTKWVNNLLKENPYSGMNYLRTIVDGGKNDTPYTDKAVIDAYNIALDKITTDPQLNNKIINKLIKKTEEYEGFDIGNNILSKFERGEITDFDGYDYNMWTKVRETKIQQNVDSGIWTKEQGNEYLNRDVAQPEDMKEAVKEGTEEGINKALSVIPGLVDYNEYNSNPSLADVDSNTINKMSVVNDGSGIMPVNNPDKENILTIGGNSVYNDNSTKYYFAQKPSVDIAGAINNATTKSDPMGVVNA